MQRKRKTLKELKEKGLIKDSDKNDLYNNLLEAEKEKAKKNDAKVISIIEQMKNKNIDFIL